MAVYVLTIGGSTKALQEDSLDIRETTNGRNLMNCAIKSLDGTYRPAIRAEVILTEDGTRIFGGNIDAPSEHGVGKGATGSGPEIITTVSASDFNALADRRQVTEEIPAGTLKAALLVLEPYLTDYGVTLSGSQATGPSLPALSYVSRKLTDVFDELSALTNYEWTWNIDYNKSLRMVEIGTAAAPFNVTDSNRMVEGDITVEPTTTDYANFIILLAGSGQKEVTDSFTGDGVTTNFPLNYTLVSDRGYVTNGVDNETLGTGAMWEYDPVTNSITRFAAPANLNAISIIYTAQFPLQVTSDGGAAPADLVEKTYVNDAIFDRTVAQALADSLLARDSVTPKTVKYTTAQTGIHPGQTQTITSTKRNLSGDFLITDVQIVTVAGHFLRRQVTAVSVGPIPASWRETIKQWSGTSGASAAAASVTIVTSGGVGGSGTPGTLAKWATAVTLEDSIVTESGSVVTVAGTLAATILTAPTYSGSVSATGAWTFTATPIISSTEPALVFNETDQGSNLKNLRFDLQGGVLQVQTLNDAFSVLATILTLSRAGALAVSGGITAGSGVVGIVDSTGKIPAISSTYFASLSGVNLTGVDLLASVNTHTAAGIHTWSGASATTNRLFVENTTSGATAAASMRATAGTTGAFMIAYSQGFTTAGASFQAGVEVIGTGVGGVSINASDAAGNVRIYSRNALAATFGASQHLTVTASILPAVNYVGNLGATATKFLQAHIAELVVETLVAANTTATIGGRVLVAPTNILTADLAPAGGTITLKYNNFANGDRIRLEAEGKLEWMAVTSSAGGGAGAYTYTVTRNLDGSGADQWYAGDAALNTGTTGAGFIDLYSTAGVLAGTGPTIVGNVRTGTTYSQISPRWAVGNLNGIADYATDIYGAYFGNSAATNVTVDATNGFRIRFGTTNKVAFDASGNGSITGSMAISGSGALTIGSDVTINTSGITLTPDTSSTLTSPRSLKWTVSNGSLALGGYEVSNDRVVILNSLYAGTATTKSLGVTLNATYQPTVGTEYTANIILSATQAAGRIDMTVGAASDGVIQFHAAQVIADLTLRSGYSVDTTSYTQTNANLLAGDNTEALGIAGSSTLANLNMYVKAVAARKVTIQAAIGGTNGGQFLVFVKPDSGADVAEALRLSQTGALKLAAYTAATFVAGDKYLVVDASGNVHRSAVGPAS